MTRTDRLLEVAAATAVLQARAEAEHAAAVLAFVDSRRADAVAAGESLAGAEDAVQVAIAELSVALQTSTFGVSLLVSRTRTLVDRLPTVWSAHADGRIDARTAHEIASASWRLHDPANVTDLDRLVLPWATTHTAAQVRAWLRRFVVRVERDAAQARREAAHADRHVRITHLDDATSLLQALIPTAEAALLERELTIAARHERAAVPTDDRTLAQVRADVLVARLLQPSSERPGRGHFHVGITVGVDTLLGLSDEPAVSGDGHVVLDPAALRELATRPGTLFSLLLTDEAGGVLDVTELGRFPTAALERALVLVDGTCRFPTCDRPAESADTDHDTPWGSDPRTRGPPSATTSATCVADTTD